MPATHLGDTDAPACRTALNGARWAVLGSVLSGPLAVLMVEWTHPQPPWQGPLVFAQHFHVVQVLPYLGGVALVAGLLQLCAGLHALAPLPHRAHGTLALLAAAIFASLITLNYGVQTTYLPVLVQGTARENAELISALSMSNPRSLAWVLEMWGWGAAGIATWLLSPVFQASRLERAASTCFRANGVLSVCGTAFSVLRPGWVLTPSGLIAFGVWNLLIVLLAVSAWLALQNRLRA